MQVGGVDGELFAVGLDASGGDDPPVPCRVGVGAGAEELGEVVGLGDGSVPAEVEAALGDLLVQVVAVGEGVGVLVVPGGASRFVRREPLDLS